MKMMMKRKKKWMRKRKKRRSNIIPLYGISIVSLFVVCPFMHCWLTFYLPVTINSWFSSLNLVPKDPFLFGQIVLFLFCAQIEYLFRVDYFRACGWTFLSFERWRKLMNGCLGAAKMRWVEQTNKFLLGPFLVAGGGKRSEYWRGYLWMVKQYC